MRKMGIKSYHKTDPILATLSKITLNETNIKKNIFDIIKDQIKALVLLQKKI